MFCVLLVLIGRLLFSALLLCGLCHSFGFCSTWQPPGPLVLSPPLSPAVAAIVPSLIYFTYTHAMAMAMAMPPTSRHLWHLDRKMSTHHRAGGCLRGYGGGGGCIGVDRVPGEVGLRGCLGCGCCQTHIHNFIFHRDDGTCFARVPQSTLSRFLSSHLFRALYHEK